MRSCTIHVLAAAASVVLVFGARAQAPAPGLRGGNKAELLQNESVQQELKLSSDQMDRLKVLAKDFEAKHKDEIAKARKDKDLAALFRLRQTAMEFFSKEMKTVLSEEQLRRLDQIEMQLHGVQALMRVDVGANMKLTDKQRKEIHDILDKVQKDVQSAMESAKASADKKEEVGRRITQLHKLATEKAFNLLSEDQKKTWTGIVGDPFELKAKVPPSRPSGGDKDRPGKN